MNPAEQLNSVPATPDQIFEQFRENGHSMIDAITEYWQSIESRPVTPSIDPLPELPSISDQGAGLERAVEDLQLIFNNSLAMSHPLYLGLVNSSPLPQAVLGDLLVSTLDNNGGASHQGPAHIAAEKQIIRELQLRLQYQGDGMFLPGGSYANHQALILARQNHFPEWAEHGPTSLEKMPRIYTGDAAHFSVDRGAHAIGLGRDSVVPVRTLGRGEIDHQKLAELIQIDLEQGHQPFCVVATAGTTGTGAIDCLESVYEICERFRLWFHVDACYGGALMLSEHSRHLLNGIALADSISIDMHKWFFMPLIAGVLLTKHVDLPIETFNIDASYIPSKTFEPYTRGLPTSRRSTALGVWFGLHAAGWKPIRSAVDRNIELTRYMEEQLSAIGLRVLPDGELSIACARFEPEGLGASDLDQLQNRISTRVREAGHAWFATTFHDGKIWMRMNMVNLHTRAQHVDQLVQVIQEIVGNWKELD